MVKYTTNQINEINRLIKNSFLNQTQISEAVNKKFPNTTNQVSPSTVTHYSKKYFKVPTGGALNGISADQINGTYTQISNVTLDSYDINPADNTTFTGTILNPTQSGDIGSNAVTATQNRLYDVLNLSLQTMTVA